MPEGPELRHSRDVLRSILAGKEILRFDVLEEGRYKSKEPVNLSLICRDLPLQVHSVDTKGKFMWWTLKSSTVTWYVWVTYGMSGQWTKSRKKHAGLQVEYSGSKHLFFVDPRRFGTIKFTKDPREHEKKLTSLGPDVLEDPPLPPELFAERILLKPQRTISEALMDQGCISGVGNYLKAEALFRSGVSPHRIVSDMTSQEMLHLWSEVILACRESYADQGASLRTYKTVSDEKGRAQFQFRVYSQKNCPSGHEVTREETLDKRTSWWCSACQK